MRTMAMFARSIGELVHAGCSLLSWCPNVKKTAFF